MPAENPSEHKMYDENNGESSVVFKFSAEPQLDKISERMLLLDDDDLEHDLRYVNEGGRIIAVLGTEFDEKGEVKEGLTFVSVQNDKIIKNIDAYKEFYQKTMEAYGDEYEELARFLALNAKKHFDKNKTSNGEQKPLQNVTIDSEFVNSEDPDKGAEVANEYMIEDEEFEIVDEQPTQNESENDFLEADFQDEVTSGVDHKSSKKSTSKELAKSKGEEQVAKTLSDEVINIDLGEDLDPQLSKALDLAIQSYANAFILTDPEARMHIGNIRREKLERADRREQLKNFHQTQEALRRMSVDTITTLTQMLGTPQSWKGRYDKYMETHPNSPDPDTPEGLAVFLEEVWAPTVNALLVTSDTVSEAADYEVAQIRMNFESALQLFSEEKRGQLESKKLQVAAKIAIESSNQQAELARAIAENEEDLIRGEHAKGRVYGAKGAKAVYFVSESLRAIPSTMINVQRGMSEAINKWADESDEKDTVAVAGVGTVGGTIIGITTLTATMGPVMGPVVGGVGGGTLATVGYTSAKALYRAVKEKVDERRGRF